MVTVYCRIHINNMYKMKPLVESLETIFTDRLKGRNGWAIFKRVSECAGHWALSE